MRDRRISSRLHGVKGKVDNRFMVVGCGYKVRITASIIVLDFMVMNCWGSEGGQGESKRVSLGMQGRETILERGVSEVKQETLTDSEGPAVE